MELRVRFLLEFIRTVVHSSTYEYGVRLKSNLLCQPVILEQLLVTSQEEAPGAKQIREARYTAIEINLLLLSLTTKRTQTRFSMANF